MIGKNQMKRWTALLGLLFALFAMGAFVVPAGCGGGSGETKKKKKKKKDGDKKDQAKKDDGGDGGGGGGGDMSEEDLAIELAKDEFKGVFNEYMQGNSQLPAFVKALEKLETTLAKYPREKWQAFETDPWGLNNARVEVAHEYGLGHARKWALDNLENVPEGKAKLQAIADSLKDVVKDQLAKNENVDYQKKYDDVLAGVKRALAELEDMSALIKRVPPSGETNILNLDKGLFRGEGDMDWSLGGMGLTMAGKGDANGLTAMHFYLKDFKATITFHIINTGFDVLFRALPEKSSSMFMGLDQGNFPEPFTLIVEVKGNHIAFKDTQGRVMDEFDTGKAAAGGGIRFRLRKGAEVNVMEFKVEPW